MEPYFITTANNERYQCLIVDNADKEQDYNGPYYGSNPIELLSPLFSQNTCSYRVCIIKSIAIKVTQKHPFLYNTRLHSWNLIGRTSYATDDLCVNITKTETGKG